MERRGESRFQILAQTERQLPAHLGTGWQKSKKLDRQGKSIPVELLGSPWASLGSGRLPGRPRPCGEAPRRTGIKAGPLQESTKKSIASRLRHGTPLEEPSNSLSKHSCLRWQIVKSLALTQHPLGTHGGGLWLPAKLPLPNTNRKGIG